MERIIYLLTEYRYFILLPLAIVEGPIIAIIAGFLCANGLLNPWIAFTLIVLGDVIGDLICYMLGRWGVPEFIKKISPWLGITKEKIDRTRIFFSSNPTKSIFLSKITLGIGVAGIYLAGNARVAYNKFIAICLVTSMIQYVMYLGIGLLFGSAYMEISHYLNYFTSFSILAALIIFLFLFLKSKFKKT